MLGATASDARQQSTSRGEVLGGPALRMRVKSATFGSEARHPYGTRKWGRDTPRNLRMSIHLRGIPRQSTHMRQVSAHLVVVRLWVPVDEVFSHGNCRGSEQAAYLDKRIPGVLVGCPGNPFLDPHQDPAFLRNVFI